MERFRFAMPVSGSCPAGSNPAPSASTTMEGWPSGKALAWNAKVWRKPAGVRFPHLPLEGSALARQTVLKTVGPTRAWGFDSLTLRHLSRLGRNAIWSGKQIRNLWGYTPQGVRFPLLPPIGI